MTVALKSTSLFQPVGTGASGNGASRSDLSSFSQNYSTSPGNIVAIRPAGELFSPNSPQRYSSNENGWNKNFNYIPPVAEKKMWKGGETGSQDSGVLISKTGKVAKVTSAAESTSQAAILGPLVLGASDFIADVSGALHGDHSGFNLINGQNDTTALAALAVTSGFNLVTGPFGVYDGWNDWKTTGKVKDQWGQFLAVQKMTRSVAQTATGAVYVPFRALSIAAAETGSKVVGSVANVFGQVGLGITSFLGVLCIITNACKIHEERLFAGDIKKLLNDQSLPENERYIRCLKELKSKLGLSKEEKTEIRKAIEGDPKFQQLSKEEREDKIKRREDKAVRKKELQMARVSDRMCVEKVKSAKTEEAKEVIEKVCKANTKKMIISGVSIALAVLGIIGTIVAVAFTGGAPLIVAAVIGLITSVGFLMIDGYQLMQDFKTSESGRYDHLWVFISTVVCFVAITLSFLFSGGMAALIVAGVLGLIWLAINLGCFIRMRKRQKAAQLAEGTE